MKLVATKLDLETVDTMSKLVIENVDAIADDLTVLDSRLLLGNANVDVVALDGTGALVLIAIDRTSHEQLLLKAVEAYSWCLEYPEAVRRLYPAAHVSVTRPPRVMFVVERMSDSFHRKVKQLGFPEVDCVEFRHLAIDGAEAVHFDTIVRLRRATVLAEDARPTPPETAATPAPEPAPLEVSTAARATRAKLQKLLTADTPAPSAARHAERPVVERPMAISTALPAREPGVVVSMVNRTARHAAARLEEVALVSAPIPSIAPAAKELEPSPAIVPEAVAVAPMLELVVEPKPPVAEAVSAGAAGSEPIVAPDLVTAVSCMLDAETIAAPDPVLSAPVPEPGPVLESQAIVAEPVVAEPVVAELVVEPKPVVTPEPIVAAPPMIEPIVEPEPVIEPVVAALPEPEPVPEPEAVVEAAPAVATPEPPRISFADLSKELLASQPAAQKAVTVTKPVAPTRPLEPPVSIKPPAAGGAARLSLSDLSTELLRVAAPVRTPPPNGPTPIRLQVPPVTEPPKVGEITRSILEQIASADAEAPAPVREPAAPAATPVEAAPEAKVQGLPQEFEGLKFPGDGVLTRQWMDFLNQMTAAK